MDAALARPWWFRVTWCFQKQVRFEVQCCRWLRHKNGRNGKSQSCSIRWPPPVGRREGEASLEGVAVAKGEHLVPDAEGGAQETSPKTRYLTTAIAVMLASSSRSPDHDCRRTGAGGGGR